MGTYIFPRNLLICEKTVEQEISKDFTKKTYCWLPGFSWYIVAIRSNQMLKMQNLFWICVVLWYKKEEKKREEDHRVVQLELLAVSSGAAAGKTGVWLVSLFWTTGIPCCAAHDSHTARLCCMDKNFNSSWRSVVEILAAI